MQRYKTKRPRVYRCKICTLPAKQVINYDGVRVCTSCFSELSDKAKQSRKAGNPVKFWQLDIFGGQTPAK